MVTKVKSRDRMVNVLILMNAPEIEFLDRKINKKYPELASRSAILRYLIHKTMEKPSLLDIGKK